MSSNLTWPEFSRDYSQTAKEEGRTVTRAQISTAWKKYKETGDIPALSPKKAPIKKMKKKPTKAKAKTAKKTSTKQSSPKKMSDISVIYILYRNEDESDGITTTTIIGAYRNREDAVAEMRTKSEAEIEEIDDVERKGANENGVYFTINGEYDVVYAITETTFR